MLDPVEDPQRQAPHPGKQALRLFILAFVRVIFMERLSVPALLLPGVLVPCSRLALPLLLGSMFLRHSLRFLHGFFLGLGILPYAVGAGDFFLLIFFIYSFGIRSRGNIRLLYCFVLLELLGFFLSHPRFCLIHSIVFCLLPVRFPSSHIWAHDTVSRLDIFTSGILWCGLHVLHSRPCSFLHTACGIFHALGGFLCIHDRIGLFLRPACFYGLSIPVSLCRLLHTPAGAAR